MRINPRAEPLLQPLAPCPGTRAALLRSGAVVYANRSGDPTVKPHQVLLSTPTRRVSEEAPSLTRRVSEEVPSLTRRVGVRYLTGLVAVLLLVACGLAARADDKPASFPSF